MNGLPKVPAVLICQQRHIGRRAALRLAMAVTLGLCSSTPFAADGLEVTQMSLEDLMKVEVTTVSRKSQRLADSAAAAFVVTAEDIQRSGATSIPEALRMVPGLEVARIGSSRWAVTARGFNGRFANKLLVLIDGRSVYSPLFSGVFWEAEDVMLEDVDRIEVIRGSGAALWGANAVNGIINILTKSARRTQGGLVSVQAGDEDRGIGALRYGSKVDDDTPYRLWAKANDRKASPNAQGERSGDRWSLQHAGFRLDRDAAHGARLSVTGGVVNSDSGETLIVPSVLPPYAVPTPRRQDIKGANLLARYEWTLANGSEATLQGYVDQSSIGLEDSIQQDRTTIDVDFQNRVQLSPTQDLIWGLGHRYSRDHIDSPPSLVTIRNERRRYTLWSGFVHDEITVVPERWKLILGTKVEHNSYTGTEVQPNVRALWTPTPTDSVWGAVSRAVRTPSRAERDAEVVLGVMPPMSASNPTPLPLQTRVLPNSDLGAESVVSFELGYRTQLGSQLSLDLAAFDAHYKHLRSGTTLGTSLAMQGAVPYLSVDTSTSNSLSAHSQGLEAAVDWHPLSWWRFQTAYTYVRLVAERNGDPANDSSAREAEGQVPRSQLSLRSSIDLWANQQFDVWVKRVGSLHATDIPAYTALDLRYAWRVTPQLELSLVGQNLLDSQHAEFISDLLPSEALQIPRSAYLKLRWQF